MEKIRFRLTISQKERLDRDSPFSGKSSIIGKRAEDIIKLYFLKKHPNCKFKTLQEGTDLHAVWNGGEAYLEIKGTASDKISWSKLKVSSKRSYNLLKSGLALYRVTSVFSDCPTVFILTFGKDFEMKTEERWSIQELKAKPPSSASNKSSLQKSQVR